MNRSVVLGSLVLFLCGCGGSDSGDSNDAPPPTPPSTERPSLSAAECEAQGGTVVGDIGDGRTHRPDYRCEDGQAPIADVPLGVEGSVCCPQTSCPEGGVPPRPGPDGPPEDCQVLFEGCCYADADHACEVAGCDVPCEIMESYPGQLRRCDEPASAGGGEPACAVDDGCEDIQCLRAVTCVRECGDEPVGCGCCPCADGFVDAIGCESER